MKRKEKNISLLHSLSHLRAKRTTKDAPLLPAFSLSVYCARKKKTPKKRKRRGKRFAFTRRTGAVGFLASSLALKASRCARAS